MDNHFKIIVPFYNIEKWAKIMIRSIRAQDYKNFECILINDISTDNSINIIEKEIDNDSRFKIINNEVKKYVLKNICDSLVFLDPNKEDVIIILDGDDWFAKPSVLSTLNNTYIKEGCWLTYGSYIEYPSRARGKFAKQIPKHIIENNLIRQSPWMTSHLKSWKFALWENVDFQKSFVESNPLVEEDYFHYCWDLAYMFPLLELAGNKSHFIKEILYVYNRDNPLNVDKMDHSIQLQMEQKIRNMEKYSPLKEL